MFTTIFLSVKPDGDLGYFHLSATASNTAMNSGILESLLLISEGICLGLELLDHVLTLCLALSGTAKLSSGKASPFYICDSNTQELQLLHIFTHVCYSLLVCFYFKILDILMRKSGISCVFIAFLE